MYKFGLKLPSKTNIKQGHTSLLSARSLAQFKPRTYSKRATYHPTLFRLRTHARLLIAVAIGTDYTSFRFSFFFANTGTYSTTLSDVVKAVTLDVSLPLPDTEDTSIIWYAVHASLLSPFVKKLLNPKLTEEQLFCLLHTRLHDYFTIWFWKDRYDNLSFSFFF